MARPGPKKEITGCPARAVPYLLVAPLHGAVALKEVHNILAVAQHLDLNVTGAGDKSLDKDGAVAKGGLGKGRM